MRREHLRISEALNGMKMVCSAYYIVDGISSCGSKYEEKKIIVSGSCNIFVHVNVQRNVLNVLVNKNLKKSAVCSIYSKLLSFKQILDSDLNICIFY